LTAQNHLATMWAGTNAGYVFIYQIHLPADDRRHTDTVDCVLGESTAPMHISSVHCVPKKEATKLLAVTLSNLNRI